MCLATEIGKEPEADVEQTQEEAAEADEGAVDVGYEVASWHS